MKLATPLAERELAAWQAYLIAPGHARLFAFPGICGLRTVLRDRDRMKID